MVKIKVCGMVDKINVKEVADVRPDFMGFIFYPQSPRYAGAEPDPDLFRSLPAGILKTGVFVNENIDKVLSITLTAGFDYIQLHGNESVEFCEDLRSNGIKIIKAFSITEYSDLEGCNKYAPVCDYFLFDTKSSGSGGSGEKFNWDLLNGTNIEKQFFLSGGIGPEDIPELSKIRNGNFFAVDLNSRFEESPGFKNIALLKKFMNDIKIHKI